MDLDRIFFTKRFSYKLVTKNCLTLNNKVTQMLRYCLILQNEYTGLFLAKAWMTQYAQKYLISKISSKFNHTRLFVY